jgi:electron transfer flavoprotein alpha/beta subunit
MDFQRKPRAFESEGILTVWNAADLDADPACIGLPGSPTIVSGLAEAPTRQRRRQFLEGPSEEIIAQLAKVLTDAL